MSKRMLKFAAKIEYHETGNEVITCGRQVGDRG